MAFVFAGHRLDPDRRELLRGGAPVAVEPQVFDFLLYLLRNRERVVSKDDLITNVWRGRAVSNAALATRLNGARVAVADSGAAQRVIRTVPRKGIRFVAEVLEERSEPTGPRASTGEAAPVPFSAGEVPAARDRASIAVLPFQNLTAEPAQEYFADGMVEEITTALSRIRWLFVIARNSSFAYKAQAIDVKRVAGELGVRYLLEGSVRKSGGRVRITAQLIEAENAGHLWADRFDGALDDVFDLQDRVAASVAGAIEPQLLRAEIERASRKPTASLDAYDLYLRALAQLHLYTSASLRAADTLAAKAVAADPNFARAAALIGFCRSARATMEGGFLPPDEITEAVLSARRALETGDDDPDALWMAAYTLALFAGDHATAADRVERALSLSPNAAFAWCVRGWIEALADRTDAAIGCFDWLSIGGLCFAALTAGRFTEAVDYADRTLRAHPSYSVALRFKAVACTGLGRIDEAQDCVRAMLVSQPEFSISRWVDGYAATSYPAGTLELFRDSLRLAGAPE